MTGGAPGTQPGYDRLLETLDEARGSTTRVAVELGGDSHGAWDLVLGGHVGHVGIVTFGYGWRVFPDSRVNGTAELLAWCGSGSDGARRTERFACGKTEITFTWQERRR